MENIAINAPYISPKCQSDLIAICENIIQKTIFYNIKDAQYFSVYNKKDAQYFSVLADETMDISRVKQLSICVR